jgi:hypothetical protein
MLTDAFFTNYSKVKTSCLLLLSCMLLSACGGGGGSNVTPQALDLREVNFETTSPAANAATQLGSVTSFELPPNATLKSPLIPVIVYQHKNFAGRSQFLNIGVYRGSKGELSQIGDNSISSMKIQEGFRAVACESDSSSQDIKKCKTFESGEFSWVGDSFNDKFSYIEVLSDVAFQVEAFQHNNYAGNSQLFKIGIHKASDLNKVGNNAISSLKVPSGLTVKACDNDGDDRGSCVIYKAGEYSSVGGNLNDKFSFLEVTKAELPSDTGVVIPPVVTPAPPVVPLPVVAIQVEAFQHNNYAGNSQFFKIGTYKASDLNKVGNNAISSLKIPSGLTVKACENDGDNRGLCVIYKAGEYSSVGGNLNDKFSYLEVAKAELPSDISVITPLPIIPPTTGTPSSTNVIPEPASTAKSYYVALEGSDSNSGDERSPWRTLGHACAAVKSGFGHTIRIGEGVFVEKAKQCNLSHSVNIIGAGMDRTIIKGQATDALISIDGNSDANNKQKISDFSLDGQSRSTSTRGMVINNVHNLLLENVKAYGFKDGAVKVSNLVDSEIRQFAFFNSAGVHENQFVKELNRNANWCSASFVIGSLKNVKIHSGILREDIGYGIKAWPQYAKMTNVEFYDLDIKVANPYCSKWNNLGFELHMVEADGISIHHNRLNSVLSLGALVDKKYATSKIDIHNNDFDLPGGGNVYAIECDANNVKIHQNYFYRGLYPCALWSSRASKTGFQIYENVFDGQYGPGVIHFLSGLTDSIFAYNTVVLRNNLPIFNLSSVKKNNIKIVNNAFISPKTDRGDVFMKGDNEGVVQNNYFSNIKSRGTIAATGDHKLSLDIKSTSAYLPAADSVLINKAIPINEIERDSFGNAPDVGALEYGKKPFQVGPRKDLSFLMLEAETQKK